MSRSNLIKGHQPDKGFRGDRQRQTYFPQLMSKILKNSCVFQIFIVLLGQKQDFLRRVGTRWGGTALEEQR